MSRKPQPAVPPLRMITPSPLGRGDIAAARVARIALVDGALVWTAPDGRREELCAAADVRRVVHVAGSRPRWILATATHAFELPDDVWSPGWFGSTQSRERPERIGVSAFARGLGLRPQWVKDEAKASTEPGVVVRRLDPRSGRPLLLNLWFALSLAAWVIGLPLLGINAVFPHALDSSLVSVIETAPLVGPVCWAAAVAFVAVASAPRGDLLLPPAVPEGGALLRPAPAVPAIRAFRENAWLLFGPDEVAVASSVGVEAWLPGPAWGGVNEAVIVGRDADSDRTLHLGRRGDAPSAVLRLADWAGDPDAEARLCEALTGAGIEVRRTPNGLNARVEPGLIASPGKSEILQARPEVASDVDLVGSGVLCVLVLLLLPGVGINWWTLLALTPLLGMGAVAWWRRGPGARSLTQVVPAELSARSAFARR